MNVGLTRPRSSLLVIGNSRCLKTNTDWRALVSYAAESNSCIYCVTATAQFVLIVIDARIPQSEFSVVDLIKQETFLGLLKSSSEKHTTAMERTNQQPEKKKLKVVEEDKEGQEKGKEGEKGKEEEKEKGGEESKEKEGGKEAKGETEKQESSSSSTSKKSNYKRLRKKK